MLDWLIDPDDDPEEELYEKAESCAEDEIGEFIESSYEDLDFLEILVEFIFNLCGVQLPLDADKISMFIYENSYEGQVVDELRNNHDDIYDSLIEYIADRLRDRYDDYDPDEKYERWNY